MRVTEKQMIVLIDTLAASLQTNDGAGLFRYTLKTREMVLDQLLDQQDGVITPETLLNQDTDGGDNPPMSDLTNKEN